MTHAIETQLCPVHRDAASTSPRIAGALETGAPMPSDAVERMLVEVLRCLAAAGETGDAICWDEALDRAEQVLGSRDGALVVARAAALHRSLAPSGSAPDFLPLPCRRLSGGEAELLTLLRASIGNQDRAETCDRAPAGSRLSFATRGAVADVAEAIQASRSAVRGRRPAASSGAPHPGP